MTDTADVDQAEDRVSVRKMATTNLILGGVVIVLWLLLTGGRALELIQEYWPVSLVMTVGSLIGGGTSEGGAAVAFPVLTKGLGVPPEQGRLFSFAIQTVGMGAASLSILINRVQIERTALKLGAPAAVISVIASVIWLQPLLSGPSVKLLFTAILAGLGVALVVSRRYAPLRRDNLPSLGPVGKASIIAAGLFGGALSGVAAVGENTVMFILLALTFRVCERVVTPTTVVLMTAVTITAFITHLLRGEFTGPPVDMWLAAAPVVAIGAPLGALICTRLSRDTIARILLTLITIEVVTTIWLVPMTTVQAASFAMGIVVFTLVCVRLATLRRYAVHPLNAVSSVGAAQRRSAQPPERVAA